MEIFTVTYKLSSDAEATVVAYCKNQDDAMARARRFIDRMKANCSYRGQSSYLFDGSTRLMSFDNTHHMWIRVLPETAN